MSKSEQASPVVVFWWLVAAEYVALAFGTLALFGAYLTESESVDVQKTYFIGVGALGLALALGCCAWFFGRPDHPPSPDIDAVERDRAERASRAAAAAVVFIPFAVCTIFALMTGTEASAAVAVLLVIVPACLVGFGTGKIRAGAGRVTLILFGVTLVGVSALAFASVETGEDLDFKPWRSYEDEAIDPERVVKADGQWLERVYSVVRADQQNELTYGKGAAPATKLDSKLEQNAVELGAPDGSRFKSAVRDDGEVFLTVISSADTKYAIASFKERGRVATYVACTGDPQCNTKINLLKTHADIGESRPYADLVRAAR